MTRLMAWILRLVDAIGEFSLLVVFDVENYSLSVWWHDSLVGLAPVKKTVAIALPM